MKKLFFITLVGTTLIFALLTYYTTYDLDYELIDQEVVIGKRIWQKKGCIECHSIFGNGGYNAPDLTYVVTRLGKPELIQFLLERPVIRTSVSKRHILLKQEEVAKIVSFLSFVNSVKVSKWPPNPMK